MAEPPTPVEELTVGGRAIWVLEDKVAGRMVFLSALRRKPAAKAVPV
ncbi:MAG TPA: hypothetical protein VFL90_13715 [Methylomirabilota bacterium]|nr:hypothetical protein [Methylomirabilota bacterium]